MARNIPLLTEIDPFPTRALPQARFDATVKTNMDQLENMIDELNTDFIPAVNAISDQTEADAATAAQKAADAAQSASDAADSASDALASKNAAATSEGNAADSATSASQSASTATTKATEASQSASTASTKATEASQSATTASQKAADASTSATNAANSATAAATSETNAANSATSASNSASTATTKASEASQSATTATTKASEASTSAANAATSESNASAAESNALTYCERAEQAAQEAYDVVGIDIATTSKAGLVKPDGTIITVDSSGLIAVSKATSSLLGLVKPDNSTITIDSNGVLTTIAVPWSGITGKPSSFTPSAHNHAASDVTSGTFDAARIPSLDASKIGSGTISIDRLPEGALERLVVVANQTARFALTISDVQLGDTVKQTDTGVMYYVKDTSKLNSADGYEEYTAGAATSVPWSGVTGKPSSYTPSSHSHGNVTNDGKVGSTANLPLITTTGGAVTTGSFGNTAGTFCQGNDSRLSNFGASGTNHKAGIVPDPGATAGTSKYLREDGTWVVPPNDNTVYTHPTTSGNKHIPSGGSSGQFLGWDSDGTAKWVNNPNTNTDTLMTQNVSTGNATYPILLCPTANATANQGAKTGIFAAAVKVNPSTGVLSATGFSGPLTGNVTGNCSGTAANVTGTVAIANGGTGATTRLNAVKALTNENVGTNATCFLTITDSWGKAGYSTKANARTVLGLSNDMGTGSYVNSIKVDAAHISSQDTKFGAIWNAPTKSYRVACATYPTNDEKIIWYSITNANVSSSTNTVAKSMTWDAGTGTLTTAAFSGALSGNASTATKFSANQSVALTGDVTGSASSQAGWSVATTLANSGVTAGNYGPSANASPAHSGTFSVPYITVDAKGRVTAASTKTITLPASGNTNWTSHLYAGASDGNANAATTNGNTYLIICDNSTARDRRLIKGTGATTVVSDANGVITINSTNSTYNASSWANMFGATVAASISSNACSLNIANGSVFTLTVSANVTFTFTGAASGRAATFSLILTNGGSKTVTWPSSVKWADGSAPTLTASGVDVLTFLTPNGGTNWYGVASAIGAA